MRLRPTVCLAAASLLLTACSSDDTQESDEAFCEAMEGWWESSLDINTGMNDLFDILENEGSSDDPEVIDDLHDSAASVLDSAEEARGYADTAASNIRSDDVEEAFESLNALGIDLAVVIAEAALDSEDLGDFFAALMDLSPEMEEAQNTDLDALNDTIADYGREVCGDSAEAFADQDQRYYDTNAKIDVALLGKEIATYYVDHIEPDPTIAVRDGKYYLLDTYIGEVSEGNLITDQYYEGSTDWCVEVTNDLGAVRTFAYSAMSGLQDGPCR